MFWRLHAQRLLVERGKDDVAADLAKLVADPSVDAAGLNPGAIHAMWTLTAIDGWQKAGEPGKAALTAAVQHRSAGVRRNAALALPTDLVAARLTPAGTLLDDPEPLVRLAALLRIADLAQADGDALALADRIASGGFDRDRGLMDAATSAAARHDVKVLEVLTQHKFDRPPSSDTLTIVSRLAEHHARGGPVDTIGALMSALAEADPRVSQAIIAGLAKGWPKDKAPKLDADREKAIAALLPKLSADSRGQMLGLASRWGVKGLDEFIARLAREFLASASDESKPEAARIDAARQLIDLRKTDLKAARDRHRPGDTEDAARAGERPDRRRGAERLARGRAGPRGRDGADDPGGPQGERAGAARQDGVDERAGRRNRSGQGADVPPVALPDAGPGRPSGQRRSPNGPRHCWPRGAGCPIRIARRSSRRWPRSS